jgi:hypothetical protein
MRRFLFVVCVSLFAIGGAAWGWWSNGHGILTKAAVQALPDEVPAFFRDGEGMIAHCAYDPDISKNRGAPHVSGAEHPEHYLDLELLEGKPLPKNRYEFTQLCTELGIKPDKVGFVPYALAEWTERLAVAFAEHRKWPNNPFIQSKCLVYAGFVAHYAQDMCQPLHLTIDFDGRKQPDGSVLHKGIHEKVDALIENLKLDPSVLAKDQMIQPLDDLMDGIVEEFHAGYSLLNRVYELGDKPPSFRDKDWKRVPEVINFATERAREATRFTAALYLTAWELSGKIKLEGWLDRAQDDGEAAQ